MKKTNFSANAFMKNLSLLENNAQIYEYNKHLTLL
nr:MAG TPA: hypothetical protein [Caudoviricetes sp.]